MLDAKQYSTQMNEVQILTAEGGYPTGLASRRAKRYPLGQRRHRRFILCPCGTAV